MIQLPTVNIPNYKGLQPGDVLTLGKRAWSYVGTTEESHPDEQEESVWKNISPSPGAVDVQRVMAWSEVEALIEAGFVSRTVPARIVIHSGPTPRSL